MLARVFATLVLLFSATAIATETLEPGDGRAGSVCRWGERHPFGGPVAHCKEGLLCCYPCGIRGCDWTCTEGLMCPAYP